MSGVEIVGFDSELLEQGSLLRAAQFGGTPEGNQRYLVWKYLRNPYLEMPIVHFAVHAGEVIGMRGSMGTCWEAGGGRHVIPHGGDLVVHPRFRRRGISRRLLGAAVDEMRARGFDCNISLSAGDMGAPSALASGWTVVAELGVYESGSAPPRTIGRRLGHRLRAAAARTRIVHPAGLVEAAPFAELDSGIDDLAVCSSAPASKLAEIAARAVRDDRLRHVRDEAYFQWRLANPLSTYRLLVTPDAYLILHWGGNATQVNVVDWRSATPDGLSVLIRATVRHFPPLCVWIASLDAHVTPMLTHRTFKSGAYSTFVIRSLRDDSNGLTVGGLDPHVLANWHLQMLDSDYY